VSSLQQELTEVMVKTRRSLDVDNKTL